MRSKPLEDSVKDSSSGRRGGRPKGRISQQTQKMLEAWDALRTNHPNLNIEALLEQVAEKVFGVRMNPRVKKTEKARLKRTLRRHQKLSD